MGWVFCAQLIATPPMPPTPSATGIPTEPMPEPLQGAYYVYDGDSNLVKSIVNGKSTYYLGKLYQKKVDGETVTVQKYYSSGSAQIAVRTIQGESDTLQWLLSDHLGSISTTANADGTWNSTISYTAFGEIRTSSGITPTEFRYTGQLRQAELGLYYYVARWYDPYLNHFVQADMLVPNAGDSAAYDRYSYVRNNPVKYNDPSGHCALSTSMMIPALGIMNLYISCVEDVVETIDAIKKGERDPKTLYLEITGIKDAVIQAKKSIDQLYSDRDYVFYSDKPLAERIGPSVRIGTFAVEIGAIFAGGIQATKGLKLSKSINYNEYGPASSYINKLNLQKQLASQAQLSENGNIIAGNGSLTRLRNAGALASKYGGNSLSWAKMRSSSFTALDGTKLETHWYKNLLSGYSVEYKTKWVTTIYSNWVSFIK